MSDSLKVGDVVEHVNCPCAFAGSVGVVTEVLPLKCVVNWMVRTSNDMCEVDVLSTKFLSLVVGVSDQRPINDP